MSFAAIAGLWLAVITIPIGILYILKIKRHRRVVPYLKLWADLVADKQFTTLFQRLQRLLSLLLQLLIALCLVFAFASLTLSDSYLKEESIVIVVDASASMQGRATDEDERSRFEVAVESVRDLCEGRSAEDEFAIVAAGAQPEVLQGFTRSTLRLREGADRLEPSKTSGDLSGAVELAEDLLQGKKNPRILIVGDAAGGQVAELQKQHENLRWIPIGETVDNISIRRFQVRRNFALDTDYLLLSVANEGEAKAEIEIEVSVEGRTRKVLPMTLESGEVRSDTHTLTLQRGGFAKAEVVHPKDENGKPGRDGLALDDIAYASVPTRRSFSVLLVARNEAEEEPFRASMSALGGLVNAEQSLIKRPEEWAQLSADEVDAFDLVMFVNWAPKTLPRKGRFLAVNALPGGLPAKLRGVEQSPRIRDIDKDHSINRFLEAKTINPAEARPVDLTGGDVIISTMGGPVGVVFRETGRQSVYLGFDALSDLFFLKVAFPIMLRNVLGWMHEEESQLLEPTYRPGEVIRPRFTLPDESVDVAWFHEWVADEATAKGTDKLKLTDGKFYFGDTAEPGRYVVRTSSGEFRTAVNLFDAAESDLRIPESEDEQELDIERSGFLFGRDLWPLLMLVAAVLWLLEWGLYHRRLTE